MMTVGVLVTNYNSWELAIECIKANLSLCGPKLARIVLVDDCSPGPTPDISCLDVDLVRNETNIGFAASLNKGLALLNTDIVMVFDADARPLHDYIDVLLEEFTTDPSLALLGFRTVDEKGDTTPSVVTEPGASSLVLGQALHARLQPWLERNEHRICITACAMAIRKVALRDLTGFDEKLDWLDVDLDFSMNIHRSTWKVKTSSNLIAFHKGGGTPMLMADRVLRFYQNRWRLLRKYGKIKYPGLVKGVILARLSIEYLFLRMAGTLLYKDEVTRTDKIRGRQAIIQYCKACY